MLQSTCPPVQLFKALLPMFVRKRVNDVVNLRTMFVHSDSKSRNHDPDSGGRGGSNFLHASISLRNWLTVTTSSSLPTRRELFQLPHNASIVSLSPPASGVHQSLIRQLNAHLFQGDQMARKIAAIHRRNVLRLQRLERSGVVPIEEMAAQFCQLAEGR